ncbi:hypothetical protein CEXT_560321 [Caerostris extrusa]|uniref:Uncharacterized protein n=1 Tax=Caerostris extrusa TaxID=172846 RepID=A0AAV4MIP9_CAEEX|nr:hypothetical protein CEXT_560321 [Caerostris extrusa]
MVMYALTSFVVVTPRKKKSCSRIDTLTKDYTEIYTLQEKIALVAYPEKESGDPVKIFNVVFGKVSNGKISTYCIELIWFM